MLVTAAVALFRITSLPLRITEKFVRKNGKIKLFPQVVHALNGFVP